MVTAVAPQFLFHSEQCEFVPLHVSEGLDNFLEGFCQTTCKTFVVQCLVHSNALKISNGIEKLCIQPPFYLSYSWVPTVYLNSSNDLIILLVAVNPGKSFLHLICDPNF